MSFPRYPQYKQSGVEWLGAVPEHWTTTKLGRLLESPPCYGVLVPDFEQDGVPMLRITDMENGSADRSSLTTISQALSKQYSRTIVEEGDVVLSVVGTIGEAFRIDSRLAGVNLSRAVARIQPMNPLCAEFLCWIFQAPPFKRYVDLICVGTAQRVLNMADLSGYVIAAPDDVEQITIASFLSRETAKIDALVAEQRCLVELLKEKRQAVISRAVTKGLNPHAPMKDSAIEWLGKVPAHWEIRRIKHISTFTTSGPRGWSERVGEHGSLFIQSGDLNDSLQIEFSAARRVAVLDDAESNRCQLLDGDVVVCITGAKTGNIAVCTATPETAYVNQHLCLVRPGADVVPTFLGASLKSIVGQTHFELSQYGLKQGLSLEDVNEAPAVLPPREEQMAIVAFIEQQKIRFDALSDEAERAIHLLQERRTALISAAVTGQIDVRQLAEKQAAA